MVDIATSDQVLLLLSALAEQLGSAALHYEVVVVGGSALLVLGIISRATNDVDVVAFLNERAITKADPFPRDLIAEVVA